MEFILTGGPQDGCKIQRIGSLMPPTVYVGASYLGDGFSAWSSEWCNQFPARYDYDGNNKFIFQGYKR
jgi:hypothetical protein